MITRWLHRLNQLLPRSLTTRIMLGMVLIVVLAGATTTLVINQILANSLRQELNTSGSAITSAIGESLLNALLEGNLASIQEVLNNTLDANAGVVYLFAYGPNTPIVHTFSTGFPLDLLSTINSPHSSPPEPLLMKTKNGLVRDFVYRPVNDIPAEVHLGISEKRIQIEQHRMTSIVLLLTVIGCLLASGMTYGFSRLAMYPLVEFTRHVRRLDKENLDERILISSHDEVGELAKAFNHMVDKIQTAINHLSTSEAGYRILLTAAGEVGGGIALIADKGQDEGKLLFVNNAFAQLVGFENHDLVGMNVSCVLHPDSIELAHQTWESIRTGGLHSGSVELGLTSRKGKYLVVETASTLIEYQGQPVLAWFTHDISNLKRKEQELRLRNRELAARHAVTSALSKPFAPGFLQRGLHEILRALELQIGWVTLIQSDGKSEIAASEGVELQALETQFPACSCGTVFRTGQPELVEVNEHCSLYPFLRTSISDKLHHATVPLQAHGKTFGVLSVVFGFSYSFNKSNQRLLSAIGRQMGITLANIRLWDELSQKEQLLRELLARSLHAQEGERQRIARELHDATGQSLNAILFGLKTVEAALVSDPVQTQSMIARLKSAASDTVRELQAIIYDLRPSILDDLGLIPALRWYAETRLETQGINVTWDISGEKRRLPDEIETALFRIGQEAMANVAKHASADEVHICLVFGDIQLNLQISDDGQGFDLNNVFAHHVEDGRGLGLLGMRERADLLGGTFKMESKAEQGTRVYVSLPLIAAKTGDISHE